MDFRYCEEILPKVSRTFALNIVQLEGDTYRAVTIIYLLFRIADTFEDNLFQKENEKIKTLLYFAGIFEENKDLSERLNLYESLKFQWEEESCEKALVENGDKVLNCYFDLPAEYRRIIDPLLVESVQGMAKFQKKKMESSSKIFQLQDIKEVEEYCYYVAGIVGIMLTRIFSLQKGILPIKNELEKYQVQFGLALQLTNILKDWQKDLNRGWCYIPASIINLKDIDSPKTNIDKQQDVIITLIPWLLSYFDAALKYIETLPINERSIRRFCIIPFVLAYKTLNYLMKMEGDKIPREEVPKILELCRHYANSNKLLRKDYLKVIMH